MAKQTFTTGQVLTAAQMTSLQQTAMGGGSATAKTASYTLVAADAGTTVIMNSASATTITVNTSLFSAGDTVFIQNIGAGVSTITAGTATVNTASSLALAQYDSGSLYFTAAGASIFNKADGVAAAAGGMTLLDTMTLSGGSTTSTSFSSAYKQLIIYVKGAYIASGNEYHGIRLNADTGSNYSWSADAIYNTTSVIQSTFNGTTFRLNSLSTTNADDNAQRGVITITRPSDTDYVFINSDSWMRLTGSSQNQYWSVAGAYNNAAAITSITFLTEGSTYSGGTVYIYGVN